MSSINQQIAMPRDETDSATKLTTARTISATGDATWAVSFDGSANVSSAITLSNSGASAGTYRSVTVDTKGRVTSGTNPTTLAGYGISDATPSSHIGSMGTEHGVATTSVAGFMSAADKTKLNGIAAGANAYTHPASGVTAGTYKSVTVDAKGHVTTGTNPTTLAGYGITDALSTSGNAALSLVNADITSASLTTSTTTANQIVDSFSSTTYRTAKYLIQATSGTSYHSCEAMVIHNGTTASLVVYGDVKTGPSLMTLDAGVSDGNVRLLATPANATTTIKVVRTSINA